MINTLSTDGLAIGWGIPMATDTALAIGVLAALAARVPRGVVAFLVGVGMLAGVGFTMSTFVAHLAFGPESPVLASAKLAIVLASAIAAAVGYLLLRYAGGRVTPD